LISGTIQLDVGKQRQLIPLDALIRDMLIDSTFALEFGGMESSEAMALKINICKKSILEKRKSNRIIETTSRTCDVY
jgi:hypothetical protein